MASRCRCDCLHAFIHYVSTLLTHRLVKREQARKLRSRIDVWGPVNAPATLISDRCTKVSGINEQFVAARHHPSVAAHVLRDTDEQELSLVSQLTLCRSSRSATVELLPLLLPLRWLCGLPPLLRL